MRERVDLLRRARPVLLVQRTRRWYRRGFTLIFTHLRCGALSFLRPRLCLRLQHGLLLRFLFMALRGGRRIGDALAFRHGQVAAWHRHRVRAALAVIPDQGKTLLVRHDGDHFRRTAREQHDRQDQRVGQRGAQQHPFEPSRPAFSPWGARIAQCKIRQRAVTPHPTKIARIGTVRRPR